MNSPFFKSLKNQLAPDTSLDPDENAPTLKMGERPDWSLFRSIDGLQQKAGVPATRLRRLVMKEIADNALDTGTGIDAGQIDDHVIYVADNGPGLGGTPQEIAELFSIRRPMRSSKLLRLPQRGALGNGLRVVAGAVLASEGSLVVITRNRRIVLRPESDGSTTVVAVSAVDHPTGTRIEIGFGPALPRDYSPFAWVKAAGQIAGEGKSYEGKSSPYWYDAVAFHELLLAYGDQPVRSLIAQLDGCSGGKAGEIVSAAGLDRMPCASISRSQAAALLEAARNHARPVNPERLGFVGRDAYPEHYYAIERGYAHTGSETQQTTIPFVVEAWAKKTSDKGDIMLAVMVNRTPVTGEIKSYRDDKDICIFGCGLSHDVGDAPTKGSYAITVNIITPYCPITSDGKAPNLRPFIDAISGTIGAATRKAQRAAPKERRVSQKDVVLETLDDAIAAASGDGKYRFGERQILYQVRPIVFEQTGKTLLITNFKNIITDYENEHGEIPLMYREPRGSIYHPHRKETITLCTLMVEQYERPPWTFNKLLYIEKEGFSEALKESGWAERNDCGLTSSKGFTTRAVRDLVDKLAEHDERVTVFCAHDADAYGTVIYQTFQEATKARGARKITIVNLGLEPWEAVADGLEVEDVEKGDKRKPVANYVIEREDGDEWEEWLQTHRVELNVMTTPQFIAWLDRKMAEHSDGKLVPPADVLEHELEERLEGNLRDAITERILEEADLEGQIAKALSKIKRPSGSELAVGIRRLFARSPEKEWRAYIDTVVAKATGRHGRPTA